MFVQYVEPRSERWSRLQETMSFPTDTCTALFVEATPSEAAAIVERFDLHAESDRFEPRRLLHRSDGIERLTFLVSSDLTHAAQEVGHHPYHQLYNGHSPWWKLADPLAFADLDDLAGFVLPPAEQMIPVGFVSKYRWPNDRPDEEQLRRDWVF
ncbi:hypothetical protein AXK58_06015 [Tsukamurella tyrosinosolvens]|uniref:Uncharacterized protein n=2 Tax=Tsukamurella tyrosinosolvens TaxID=57704 RepID=A0A1H4MDZ9_TSUTY|nr:hypothetical protein AXK58_06015 [Tsukamurella tyrosinosolvens]SEB80765.1 hypothetical protein SAMN04489793_0825 [Tsukamurella tyrosinosolvens]